MSGIRLRVTVSARSPHFSAETDEALGQGLLEKVVRVANRGPLPPAVILLREDDVRVVYVAPLLSAVRDRHRALASLAGQQGVSAMAVLGRFTQRERGAEPRHLAGVFIEWSDGRWWASWRPIEESGRFIPTDEDEVLRAVDGCARPSGLGGWFSRARFEGLHVELEPVREPVTAADVEEPVN